MPQVHIDGIIFSLQSYGGISVYFRELAAHLLRREVPVTMSVEAPTMQAIRTIAPAAVLAERRGRYLERIRRCRPASATQVFHSSYYRKPADARVPTVVTVYDFIAERYASTLRSHAHTLQKRRAVTRGQVLICLSDATRQDLYRFCDVRPNQPVVVIPCGVSRAYRPVSVIPPERPFVLFVGTRTGYKNFSVAVRAMSALPDLDLLCVGGGPLHDAELGEAPAGVRLRIRHAGHVSEAELNTLYNQAVCLVFPSRYEGFGIPVAEAMRAGCPVVSIDCAAVVETGGAALERAADDSDEVAAAIGRLTDPVHRARKVAEGLAVGARYDWAACHDATLQAYEEALRRHA